MPPGVTISEDRVTPSSEKEYEGAVMPHQSLFEGLVLGYPVSNSEVEAAMKSRAAGNNDDDAPPASEEPKVCNM